MISFAKVERKGRESLKKTQLSIIYFGTVGGVAAATLLYVGLGVAGLEQESSSQSRNPLHYTHTFSGFRITW
jgi:hypothetical protein